MFKFRLARLLGGLLLIAPLMLLWSGELQPTQAQSPPLSRIVCPAGYTTGLFSEGLTSPDGLAFDPAGRLYVVEEGAGQVSRVAADGSTTLVLSGLRSPEGITFDSAGTLLVVEDVSDGRVVSRAGDGITRTLSSGLSYPEGVAWLAGENGPDRLYVTESNLEAAGLGSGDNLSNYLTYLTEIEPLSGQVTRIYTQTPVIKSLNPVIVELWSYAGLTAGTDGRLYVTNELAGLTLTGMATLGGPAINFTAESKVGVVSLDPQADASPPTFLASALTTPEGIRFTAEGHFPLYVAEENTDPSSLSTGRISQIAADGTVTHLCSGFGSIEDVVVDEQGVLYVSEDSSGSIIAITPPWKAGQVVYLPVILHR